MPQSYVGLNNDAVHPISCYNWSSQEAMALRRSPISKQCSDHDARSCCCCWRLPVACVSHAELQSAQLMANNKGNSRELLYILQL